MSSDGGLRVPTSRQYQSVHRKLPSSASASNFGSPFPRATTQTALNTKHRRNTSTLLTVDHLHGAPTVASSGLTASVLSKDISIPTPKPHRLSMRPRPSTPSRIPTPVSKSILFSTSRAVSSPAAPQKSKYNPLPITHRLLGPIQPGPPPNSSLTKSRTMNVLSNITSTVSRSTHSLTSSRSSYGSFTSQNIPPTSSCLPVPAITANIRQISTTMPLIYWLGRYQALHDRFRSDFLDPSFLQSHSKRDYWTAIPDDLPDSEAEPISSCRGEERLAKRVFAHLEALCTNNDARKSLRAFQQEYARKFACEALLPLGGCMIDREQGFIAKAGRLFSGGGGRKSSFGVPGRRSAFNIGVAVEDAGY